MTTRPSTGTERYKTTTLVLTYPPISNQEAEWVSADAEVVEMLRESDFYMIVGRAEALFGELAVDEDHARIDVEISVDGGARDRGTIDLQAVIEEPLPDTFFLEAGAKLIRLWDRDPDDPGGRVLQWFTPDKLLWDMSRGVPGLSGWAARRDLSVFDLLYVGIADTGDSFQRLIANGHTARQRILANERQRSLGARPTDETYLLLFRAEPTFITSFGPDHEFVDADFSPVADGKSVVKDAEKAFIRLLDPKYNKLKYKQYPQGRDGLYGSGLTRYGYVIGEDLAVRTPDVLFRGRRSEDFAHIPVGLDMIMVAGDDVAVVAPA